MTTPDLISNWDGPVTILLALLVWRELHEFRKELREFRKANSRLVELLARQDERSRFSGRAKRPSNYMTETPHTGVPILLDDNEGDKS